MVQRHSGILLSQKKEHIWVSSNEVDEPGAYLSERGRQTLYINAYTWNLERHYKGGTDIKNWLLDSVGEGEGVVISENSIETCALLYVN